MGLATLSSPQSLIKTVLRGLFQIPRAILALPSPSNSAISLYCLIFSPGLYVGIDAILVTTSIPAINFPIIFQFNSHKTNSYNNNNNKKKEEIKNQGIGNSDDLQERYQIQCSCNPIEDKVQDRW